jgi:hypothetical protein
LTSQLSAFARWKVAERRSARGRFEGRGVKGARLAAAFGVIRAAVGEQPAQPLGMADRDLEPDIGAVAPADQRRPVDLQILEQGEVVVGHPGEAVGLVGARAAAAATPVGDDHPVVFGEGRHQEAEFVRVGQAAMDQQHRITRATRNAVKRPR